jgi:glc operon protein GlcG
MTKPPSSAQTVHVNVRFQRLYDVSKAILDRCIETGSDATIVAVDRSGDPVVMFRTDHAPSITLEAARRKALTAAGMQVNTKILSQMAMMDPLMSKVLDAMDALAVPGGFPIHLDGACIGGVGIAAGFYMEDHDLGEWVLTAGDRA